MHYKLCLYHFKTVAPWVSLGIHGYGVGQPQEERHGKRLSQPGSRDKSIAKGH